MRQLSVLVAAAVALGVAAAGCGSGSGSGDRLTKEEFITQADAICAKYDKRFDEIEFPQANPVSAEASDEDVKAFAEPLSTVSDELRKQINELDNLRPPEDFQERYDDVLSDLDTSAEAAQEASDAARDVDKSAFAAAIAKGQTASEHADGIAKEYGLKVCGAN